MRHAKAYSKLERSATALKPADALPRRLQACMQELLSANERHHALLNQQRDTDEKLHKFKKLKASLLALTFTKNILGEAKKTETSFLDGQLFFSFICCYFIVFSVIVLSCRVLYCCFFLFF